MTEEELKAIEYFENCIKTKSTPYLYKSTPHIKTVLNLVKKQQEKIEYYKKQKEYDDQFKHELLEQIRCKSLEIDSLNKVLDDRLIYIKGGRGLYAKLRGLDKEYLIREYLLMHKMCKAEIEKKDKIIDNAIIEIEQLREYFSEDIQPDFIRVLEILKDKKVIDW